MSLSSWGADTQCACSFRDRPDLRVRWREGADGSWSVEDVSESGIGGDTSGRAKDVESKAAVVQALRGFCGVVRRPAEFCLASSSEPRNALKYILQAADRCPTSPSNASSCHCASCELAGYSLPSLQSAGHSAPLHTLSACMSGLLCKLANSAPAESETRLCRAWASCWRISQTGPQFS